MDLYDRVKSEILQHKMISRGDFVLLGVSGGPDSVALMDLFSRISKELEIRLHVFHLNHMLRGQEATDDAVFVESMAGKYGIPVTVKEYDVAGYVLKKKLSLQEGAREVRLQLLEETAAVIGANRIALGQHADDQAETVLINLIRGAGMPGLKGIHPVRSGKYIRPLLGVRRSQIEEYCRESGLSFRTDSSNMKRVYLRNRVRLELIPFLEKNFNPAIVDSLTRLAEILRDEDSYLEDQAGRSYQNLIRDYSPGCRIILSLADLQALSPAIKRRVLRMACRQLTGDWSVVDYSHMAGALKMLDKPESNAGLEWPGGIRLVKRYGRLELTRKGCWGKVSFYELPLVVPGITDLPAVGKRILADIRDVNSVPDWRTISPGEALLDLKALGGPLKVRRRKEGDLFWPLGADGAVKLKKFLIDQKIPLEERDYIPMVVSGENIVWVAGLRPGDPYRVSGSGHCLYLKVLYPADE